MEGWHNKINKKEPPKHEIVELFKTEQTATEVSLLQLEASGVVAPTRRASIQANREETKDNSREVFKQ